MEPIGCHRKGRERGELPSRQAKPKQIHVNVGREKTLEATAEVNAAQTSSSHEKMGRRLISYRFPLVCQVCPNSELMEHYAHDLAERADICGPDLHPGFSLGIVLNPECSARLDGPRL